MNPESKVIPGHLINKIVAYAKVNIILRFEEYHNFSTIIFLQVKLPCSTTISHRSAIGKFHEILDLIISSNNIDITLPDNINNITKLQTKRDKILCYLEENDELRLHWCESDNRQLYNIWYHSGKLVFFGGNTQFANIQCTKDVFVTAINDYIKNKNE